MIPTIAQILADIDEFATECEEREHTDTGDAWWHLNRATDALRQVQDAVATLKGALG